MSDVCLGLHGITALSPELLTRVFEHVRETKHTGALLSVSLVSRSWKEIAAPVLWRQLHFTRPEALESAASAITASLGRGPKMGLWIKEFCLANHPDSDFNTDPTLLDNTCTILMHASNLIKLRVELTIMHSTMLGLLPLACANTLSELFVDIHQQAMGSVIYIDELKNLTSLHISLRHALFHLPPNWKPMSLPRLKTLKVWTLFARHDDPDCKTFLVESAFPSLECLELQNTTHDDSEAESLVDLYRSKQATLRRFYVQCDDNRYASVLPYLTSITQLVVSSPTSGLVASLHPSVSKLYLLCYSVEDIDDLYDILDHLVTSKSHSVRTIRIEFGSAEFRWMEGSVEDYIVDGMVRRGDFIHRLVGYMARGLVIVDEDDKTMLDYIPWRFDATI